MNRQFQNFSQNSFVDNQNTIARNISVFGNKQESIKYMDRPSSVNQSQMDYSRNQQQPLGQNRPIYNPNPFGAGGSNNANPYGSSNANPYGSNASPFSGNDMGSSVSMLSMQQQQQRPAKELGVLFYSNNCSHSKAFLASLYKSPLNDYVRKICVDNPNVKIPRIITEVPTLVARGIQRPLVGDQVMAWLDNESQKTSSSNIQNSDIQSYSFGGRDNYSTIGDINDDVSVAGSFADWNKDYYINAPLETDKGDKKKSTSSSSQISDMNQISQLRAERDSMFAPQRQAMMKNTQIDPEQFNQMFLKQQEKSFRNNLKNI